MRALVYGVPPEPFEVPADANTLTRNLARTPTALRDVPDPALPHRDWVLTRPRLTGICGSDSKQILMDFGEGDADNAMAAFCSFPQVMGHEVVADVVAMGPDARGLEVGQRVVLNPWLSCGPRGIEPLCPACRSGDYSLCWSFTDGDIKPGIHTGVSADVTGGYAELMPAHDSMLFAVPDSIPDEAAVFADPFSVSLHAITRHPPPRSGRVVVYGAGSLGLCAVAILRALYPDVAVAVVARFDAQAELARRFGAAVVLAHEPRLAVIEALVAWGGGRLRQPLQGLPMAHPGAVDVVYDTIGKPETFEVGVRVLRSRGTLVKAGVHAPGRWEWSPLYFKEIAFVGSNAFGFEEVEGRRQHAIAHYLDLAAAGRIELRPMLTHTFPLEQWRSAFLAIADQGESGAVKVAIDQRPGR
ncbi:oxidoreductase, zinc-binding dehydrogenase family protein [Mycobacterium bohemicum DSM 44277]|uniref:Oxidoreductase n=2 Tax=Mycobacterium bohemicum TaxID=56425 RepID=A0A1X1RBW1_MYCBE|nr:zinc-binding dehydrogenase [Mycobacterium bohemicum]MCV6969734.1 alcohol dehydrogenase catalytic domain-containing protein [Mycobacterium bohemicum]ORV02737.1 oxidoreductase [Mycobacterium bohemicum]CPR13439.1 oxidoreductase, zinc-binding dehydrogenase family protein [Mycobacterium bohemicum DSM 44277]